ncbi:MAG TPA: hypothetical protein IGS53_03135 [Leptolyngbyaceae cyanobacterium M33_DOE_097]|nr:hypothetical protein [Leptolyngbyaceae cyanobacterium M33_DOE_097]
MGPNLLEATNDYWRKLNALDVAYRRGEVTLEEVDARVKVLMAELGQARRATFRYFFDKIRRSWHEQQELLLGTALLGVCAYGWWVMS